jgi:hypothetical protein
MFEIEMVTDCYHYLKNNYPNCDSIVREVPFLSRCIDMVIFTKDKRTITIEFKIKNWRKALEQAKNHRLGADKSYICLPSKKLSEDLLDLLRTENIGLFLYNPNLKYSPMDEFFPAPLNNKKIKIFNDMLINTAHNISTDEIRSITRN